MNQKGITLVEVIISVGLISVVMLFLFNVLQDMQFEDAHASYAKDNQLNRAIILKNVQDDFADYKLNNVQIQNIADGREIIFGFAEIASKALTVHENSISYDGETWNMEARNEDTKYDFANIRIETSPDNLCTYTLNIDINGDGTCNYNCDTNNNGKLDEDEFSTRNESYRVCNSYRYFKIIVPVVTGDDENIIDDLEFFYLDQV